MRGRRRLRHRRRCRLHNLGTEQKERQRDQSMIRNKPAPQLEAGWVGVFLATNAAGARRPCSNKNIERDDVSKRSHRALLGIGTKIS